MNPPAALAQEQLDAYNARDLARFVACYSADVRVYRLPHAEPILSGIDALSAHYANKRFNLPKLHARLINRINFGNKVIDHELVTGVSETPLEVAAIYEVRDGLIATVWFVDDE